MRPRGGDGVEIDGAIRGAEGGVARLRPELRVLLLEVSAVLAQTLAPVRRGIGNSGGVERSAEGRRIARGEIAPRLLDFGLARAGLAASDGVGQRERRAGAHMSLVNSGCGFMSLFG